MISAKKPYPDALFRAVFFRFHDFSTFCKKSLATYIKIVYNVFQYMR